MRCAPSSPLNPVFGSDGKLSGAAGDAVEVCLKSESCAAPAQIRSAVELYVPTRTLALRA
jgi:hypothetical protein